MIRLLKFSTEWCPPCRVMKPRFEEWKKLHPEVQFESVDTDAEPEKALEYGVHVIPTFVLELDGKPVERASGIVDTITIKAWLSMHSGKESK